MVLFQIAGKAVDPPNQAPQVLPYSTSYLITGNYVAGSVDLTPQNNPADADGLSTGTISMGNSVPAGADIVAAYLYYEAIHHVDVNPTTGAKFRGTPIGTTGVKVSSTDSLGGNNFAQCWGAAGGSGSRVSIVRADVLHLLPKQFDANNQWTGKRLVNDADLAGNRDFSGVPYVPHTVTLFEGTGDLALQNAGATLVVVYRLATEPLRKIVLYDGVHTVAQGEVISQKISGFYQRATAATTGRLTVLAGTGGNNQTESLTVNSGSPINSGDPFPQTSPASDRSWASPTFDAVSLAGDTTEAGFGETATMTLSQNNTPYDCKALGAIVFSTDVKDADNDGLPDGIEASSTVASSTAPLTSAPWKNPNGEPLPDLHAMGATATQKDLFIEVNAMQADATTGHGYPVHNHMPSPEVVNMVAAAYFAHGIHAHFDVGDPGTAYVSPATDPSRFVASTYARGGEQILERPCVPTATVKCQFPDYPGTVAWKFGFQEYRDAPVGPNGEDLGVFSLSTTQQAYCQLHPTGVVDGIACDRRRFDRIRSSFFRYALYAHARAQPKSPYPCLNGTSPAEYPLDPVTHLPTGTCSSPLTDNADFHVPKSISGTADLPGGNLMITLGLWENFVGTPYVQASTTLHELGHTFDLWHGGLPAKWGSKPVSGTATANYFEPNCKPNYLSSMSYLYQVHGLFDNIGNVYLDYSGTPQGVVVGSDALPSLNETSLIDAALGPTTFPLYRPAWFVPYPSAVATAQGLSPATKFCSGSKFNPASPPASMARAEASTTSTSIDWDGNPMTGSFTATPPLGLNINFDATFFAVKPSGSSGGVPIISDKLFGYDDWSNLRLNQISAGRGSGRFSVYAGSGSTFEGSTFEGSTFEGSTFEGSTFEGSTFEGSTFEGSTFEGSTFEGSTFEGSTFEGSTFEGSTFEGSTFEGQELDAITASQLGRAIPRPFTACVLGGAGSTGCFQQGILTFTDNEGNPPRSTQLKSNDKYYQKVYTAWKAPTFGKVFKNHVYRFTTNPNSVVEVLNGTSNLTLVDTSKLSKNTNYTYYVQGEFNDGLLPNISGKSNSVTVIIQ